MGKSNDNKTIQPTNTIKPKRRPPFFITMICKIFSIRNIPLLIYLILNYALSVAMIAAIIGWLHIDLKIPEKFAKGTADNPFLNVTQEGYILCLLISLGLYVIGVIILLSPVSESFFRFKHGCRRIRNSDYFYKVVPIFNRVYEKARAKDGSISKHVKIYIDHSDEVNAFTLGRNTICVTHGLIMMDNKTIEAVLAHELGHLSHRDFDYSTIVRYGNIFVLVIVVLLVIFAKALEIFARLITLFVEMIGSGFGDAVIFGIVFFAAELVFNTFKYICIAASYILQYAILEVWFAIGDIFCHKTSRLAEYDADKFAFKIGYGEGLARFLMVCGDVPEIENEGLYARLLFSYPDTSNRIQKLIKLGVPTSVLQ